MIIAMSSNSEEDARLLIKRYCMHVRSISKSVFVLVLILVWMKFLFFISWDGIACYDYILHSIVNLHRRDEHENYDFWKYDHMNWWTSILNLVTLQKIQYHLHAWLTSIQYPTNSICLEIQKLRFLSWNHRLLHPTSSLNAFTMSQILPS